MLVRARATAADEGIGNVTFEQGDAQVHPFPKEKFDVAISCGGIMFFADPVAAFANIHHALRPGGRLAFVCAQNLRPGDDFALALAPLWTLMRQHTPPADATADNAPGPTSLADPDRIDDILTRAGLTDVTTTSITVPMVFGRDAEDAADFVFAMQTGYARNLKAFLDFLWAAGGSVSWRDAARPTTLVASARFRSQPETRSPCGTWWASAREVMYPFIAGREQALRWRGWPVRRRRRWCALPAPGSRWR
jgi:SAM-dependent methyltransferase